MQIPSLTNTTIAKYAKATAVTVYLMTGVKATVRPAFNLADKKSDKESRKYSALNEFLYQIVCLGFAAAMIPFAERGGLKLAEKQLGKLSELRGMNVSNIGQIEEFKTLANLKGFKKLSALKKMYLDKSFDEGFVSKVDAIKAKLKAAPKNVVMKLSDEENAILGADKALHLAYGGVEAGSFIASILGLTILAPMLGHELLHPIMDHFGKEKEENIGTPADTFLADAKVPEEKGKRVNRKV